MQVVIGADHRGYELKSGLATWLRQQGHEVIDVGAATLDPQDDYPDFAFAVGEKVGSATTETVGIAICGSGAGMSIAANKVPGVRAALLHTPALAEAARHDDNVNVLALGADYISLPEAQAVVSAWLATTYEPLERYERRLTKIATYEQR